MCVSINVCLYNMCVSGAHRGETTALDCLELDLEVVVSCHVTVEN